MSTEKKKVKVTSTADLQQALAAGHEASQIEFDNTAALAAARAEGVTEGKASAVPDADGIRAAAVKGERERIAALKALHRPGFDAELKAAIEAGDSAEKFGLTLWKAAQDRGITLDAIRKDSPAAAAHASPKDPKDPNKPKAPAIDTQAVYAAMNKPKE